MENRLLAVGPVDGRYASKTLDLQDYFSEYALIKYRIRVEAEYLILLCDTLNGLSLTDEEADLVRGLYREFYISDAARVKEIEQVTNHDVKAVEYYMKEKLKGSSLEAKLEFVHFGLTSQDINNTAIPLALKEAHEHVYLPLLRKVIQAVDRMAKDVSDIPMLARTHGQPASPTRMGKEIQVFEVRIEEQVRQMQEIPFAAKFGGATGNMNAHYVAYPDIAWHDFAHKFVHLVLGLKRSFPTTQIEHYDHLAALFHAYQRINTILIDFCRDIWTYISMDYFKQRISENEVGSSAMPHKVNPIDFENAEGNLGLANALYGFMAEKLPISRLQRDLTDSTVTRNIGVPIGHTLIAFQSILKGISKLVVNRVAVDADLDNNWAVVAEGIQTILRREGVQNPYEQLKALTRKNERITEERIKRFIDDLEVSEEVKKELRGISPRNYTGR